MYITVKTIMSNSTYLDDKNDFTSLNCLLLVFFFFSILFSLISVPPFMFIQLQLTGLELFINLFVYFPTFLFLKRQTNSVMWFLLLLLFVYRLLFSDHFGLSELAFEVLCPLVLRGLLVDVLGGLGL